MLCVFARNPDPRPCFSKTPFSRAVPMCPELSSSAPKVRRGLTAIVADPRSHRCLAPETDEAQSTPFAANMPLALADVRNLMKFSAASRCRVLVRGAAV